MNAALLSSDHMDWETPPDFYAEMDAEFSFDIDVCALPKTAKCERYFTPTDDGLTQTWAPLTCWMNPPYGRHIGYWMRKAYTEAVNGATVVCLIPSRTDTAWWHDYAMKGEVRFIRGRLKFLRDGKESDPAPFPCAIVVLRPGLEPLPQGDLFTEDE